MRQTKRPEDFEKFYYRYVGKGEACGCAEKIIDVHEFNRLAGRHGEEPARQPQFFGFLKWLTRRDA